MEEKYVRVKDIEMFYRAEGEGKPLVFVHGNTGSSLWFSKVMKVEGKEVFAPDLPNFGNSGHIDIADIDIYADYLKSWMETVGIRRPVILGHSLGGAVVLSLALRFPDVPEKLILIDAAPLSGLKTPEEHYPVIEMYKANRELMKQALRAVTPTMDDSGFLEELTDEAMRMNPIAFAGNARALERFQYSGKGNRYTGEVLVVAGGKDILITKEMAEQTAEELPGASVKILPEVGHSVMAENPALFGSLLREFIG